MIHKCTVLLQNCTGLVGALPGLCSDTCLMPDDDEVIDVKVEVLDVKEEEDSLLISSAGMADDEVSCLSVHLFSCLSSHPSISPSTYLPTYMSIFLSLCLCICPFIYPSIHPSVCLCIYLSSHLSTHLTVKFREMKFLN